MLPGQEIVLVAGPPEILQRAVRMLEQVDVPRLQLRMAVHLFDVEINALKQLTQAAANQLKGQADVTSAPAELPRDARDGEHSQFHVLASQLGHHEVLKLLREHPEQSCWPTL